MNNFMQRIYMATYMKQKNSLKAQLVKTDTKDSIGISFISAKKIETIIKILPMGKLQA